MRQFIITASCLLVLVALVTTKSSHAQDGPSTTSNNQKGITSNAPTFIDFKEVWLAVNAQGVLSDGTQVKARVKLNPSL